jgi:L-methionine (R)-S-oxide reductase
MTEDLVINKRLSKEGLYLQLIPQLKALVDGESNELANQANFCAAIKQTFDYLWVGFYHVIQDELVLGNFQGPIACTRIKKGKGVCGAAWENKETMIVKDVDQFPGHIACSSLSKSEIVIPVVDKDGEVISILDIDHSELNCFDEIDDKYLNQLLALIF